MDAVWTWLPGLGVVVYLINIWFAQRKAQDQQSKFFNEVLDQKVNERDQAIKDSSEKQAKTLEEYYAKKAKYHNDLLRDPNRHTPDEGKGDL